jgi:hypothetical protein
MKIKQHTLSILFIASILFFFSSFTFHASASVCFISNGCTSTSTAPGYGQMLIGGKNGEYEFFASSTLLGPGYPFSLTGNGTSTLTQFNAGLTAFASSTIGDGTLGLTVSGTATTTGNTYISGFLGVGTTTNPYALQVFNPLVNIAGSLQIGAKGSTFNGIDIIRSDGSAGTADLRMNGSGTLQLINGSGGGNVQFGAVSSAGLATQILGNSSTVLATFLNSNRSAGFGSSTPWAILSASTSSASPAFAAEQKGSGPSAIFLGGNIGVGTTTPQTLLVVNGGNVFSSGINQGSAYFGSNGSSVGVNLGTYTGGYGAIQGTSGYGNSASYLLLNPNGGTLGFGAATGLGSPSGISFATGIKVGSGYWATTAPTNGLLVQGNVGIATTSPWANLSVEGISTLGNQAIAGFVTATSTLGTATSSIAHALQVGGGAFTASANPYLLAVGTTTSPIFKVDPGFSGGIVVASGLNSGVGGYLQRNISTVNNNILNLYYDASNTTPSTVVCQKARVGVELNAGDGICQLDFFGTTAGGSGLRAAQILASADTGWGGAGDTPGRLTFSTTPDGSATVLERMRIDNAGNIGIGTTTPSQKLDVNGSINIEGPASGIIMHDTVTSSCYIIQVVSGVLTPTVHACQ